MPSVRKPSAKKMRRTRRPLVALVVLVAAIAGAYDGHRAGNGLGWTFGVTFVLCCLVAALAVDAEPERVARLALSFAAAKLAQQGPSLPDRGAVLAQMDRMSIERLALPGTG